MRCSGILSRYEYRVTRDGARAPLLNGTGRREGSLGSACFRSAPFRSGAGRSKPFAAVLPAMEPPSDHSGPPPPLTVLVPVYNEEKHVRGAIAGLQRQTYSGDLEFLFIDGRSDDSTVTILKKHQVSDSRIRVLDNPDRTIPHALNVGLRQAGGSLVARMDAHTDYPRDYLALGVRRLRAGDVASASGPAIPLGKGRTSRLVAKALGTRLGVGGADFRLASSVEKDVDSGFTGIWKRETLLALGGWDETWVVNEDAELAARLRAAGGRITCVPAMAAQYVPRNSFRALAKQYRLYGQYRAKTSVRHPSSMRRSHGLAPALVLCVGMALAGTGWRRRSARVGLGLYALTVAGVSGYATRERPEDAALLAAVYVTMHMSWGAGFLLGCVLYGPPVRALATIGRAGARGT